jgi:heme exporter protein A
VDHLLELEHVAVEAGHTVIVNEATCVLDPGQCLAIEGPNGAGKTTLIRVMATLVRPSRGRAAVFGVASDSPAVIEVRPRIGYSGHQPAVNPALTLRDNLRFVARIRGTDPQLVGEVLARVGLEAAADRLGGDCSHGMLKRADLARLLLTRPDLLLLDEPHAGLDQEAVPLVAELVEATRRRGGGAVLVSHDPTSLIDLADQRFSLSQGMLSSR